MEKWRQELYLAHYGILGQKWGVRNGPPYPLRLSDHSASERKVQRESKSSLNKIQIISGAICAAAMIGASYQIAKGIKAYGEMQYSKGVAVESFNNLSSLLQTIRKNEMGTVAYSSMKNIAEEHGQRFAEEFLRKDGAKSIHYRTLDHII